jgi:hypothetical protein
MKKGQGSVDDKWTISVVFLDRQLLLTKKAIEPRVPIG